MSLSWKFSLVFFTYTKSNELGTYGARVGERLGDSVGAIVGNPVVGESVGSYMFVGYEKKGAISIRNLDLPSSMVCTEMAPSILKV